MNQVSFPGLGLDGFNINKEAFALGSVSVKWYGIIIMLGMVLAVGYVVMRSIERGVKLDHILDLALFTILFGVFGARMYYVIFEAIAGRFDMANWYRIWDGGLAIYGGIIGGALAVFVVLKIKKISFPMIGDFICPGLLIGQLFGRWGNFMNVEAFGTVTDLPWRMCSPAVTDYLVNKELVEVGSETYNALIAGTFGVHPTFLYESLWNLAGFLFIHLFLFKKRKYDGEVVLFTFAWYGFGRMWIEMLRTDTMSIGNMASPWYTRANVWIGLVFFVICTALLVLHRVRGTNFFFKKRTDEIPTDLVTSTKVTTVADKAYAIAIPAIEAALILMIVLLSVFQNL